MRHRWCLVLAAACGGAPEARELDVTSRVPTAVLAADVSAPSRVREAPISAAHGAAISMITVSPDGQAATTGDVTGALRLWPTLDGTHPPIVLHAASPRELAIAHTDDGFAIAVRDAANEVVLLRVSADGEVVSRTPLVSEVPAAQVVGLASSLLVRRADHSIELAGTPSSRLVTEAGTTLEVVVARGGHGLAIVSDGRHVRGRWITISAGQLTWGTSTPALPVDSRLPLSLSPDGRLLLGTRPRGGGVVVDVSTGKAHAAHLCGRLDVRSPDEPEVPLRAVALGFFDAGTIACEVDGQLAWSDLQGRRLPGGSSMPIAVGETSLAFAEGKLLAGAGASLGVYSPQGPRYLGFAANAISNFHVGPLGVGFMEGEDVLVLDGALHERTHLQLPKLVDPLAQVLPLDDRFVLLATERPMVRPEWGPTWRLALYDGRRGSLQQQLANRAQRSPLIYEPTTRLLSTSDGVTELLLRFDPATHTFGDRLEIHTTQPIHSVQLVDPALAGGAIALVVHDADGGLTIGELFAEDAHLGVISPRTTYRLSGKLSAIDRAGRVYSHGTMDRDDVVITRRGIRIGRLPGTAALDLLPNHDGTLVAAIGEGRISLWTNAGRHQWSAVLLDRTFQWTANGALVARSPGAVSQIDLSTGGIAERQCGWHFGWITPPFADAGTVANLCDVAP